MTMRRSVGARWFVAMLIALTTIRPDCVLAQSQVAENTPAVTSSFDGDWFSSRWQYGFRIQGRTGVATVSNSPAFKRGDVILRIESMSGNTFRGKQINTGGSF